MKLSPKTLFQGKWERDVSMNIPGCRSLKSHWGQGWGEEEKEVTSLGVSVEGERGYLPIADGGVEARDRTVTLAILERSVPVRHTWISR